MCLDFDGHHSSFSSFVYVASDILIRLKKIGKESQYLISRPELDSDPRIESDWDSGRDSTSDLSQIL